MDRIHVTIQSDRSQFKKLRAAVTRFLDEQAVGGHARYAVRISVEEIAVNVMEHGYKKSDGNIDVTLSRRGSAIVVRVEDDGPPFDPREAPPPNLAKRLEERRRGGLGIHLVRNLADRLDYKRVNDRNCVEVTVRTKK